MNVMRSIGLVVIFSLVLTACSIGGGGKTTIIRPTIGQELVDLEMYVVSPYGTTGTKF